MSTSQRIIPAFWVRELREHVARASHFICRSCRKPRSFCIGKISLCTTSLKHISNEIDTLSACRGLCSLCPLKIQMILIHENAFFRAPTLPSLSARQATATKDKSALSKREWTRSLSSCVRIHWRENLSHCHSWGSSHFL